MLHADADSVALDAADISSRHLSGKQGILGEIFEVTAAERIAVKVLSRGKENVNTIFLYLVAHRRSQFFNEGSIP